MRIAFYAPLKSPNHALPSGDREMARLLIRALESVGHSVELASELRSFSAKPDEDHYARSYVDAAAEVARLRQKWRQTPPDIFFCYHPYYKSPDLIGPALSQELGLSYVTAESSFSARRGDGAWAATQQLVLAGINQAAVNICFTDRDQQGIREAAPDAFLAMLPPFIDVTGSAALPARRGNSLIAVAMMRPGDKRESYRILARALGGLLDQDWTLTIVGNGSCRPEIEADFSYLPPERIRWRGELPPPDVYAALASADLYVWPGCGEAYGLAYLQAQAAGLPVVAQRTAGVPEVVQDGVTGLLTPESDIEAYAAAINGLLQDAELRAQMSAAARNFVSTERSLPAASKRLDAILTGVLR